MPERRTPLDLSDANLAAQGLDALVRAIGEQKGLPPVDRWHPTHCGDSGMRIARDGSWYHEGRLIRRDAMRRLFSTVLRRESDGSHVLVTPVEKLSIEVESTPLFALQMTMEGEGQARRIAFALDRGDIVFADADHPLIIVETADGPSPRLRLDHGLEAELARPIYYELAEAAIAEGHEPPGIWSCGHFFALSS